MQVSETIRESLGRAMRDIIPVESTDIPLERPADLQNGDYSSSVALQYTKQAAMNPRLLAEKIVVGLGEIEGVAKIEIAGAGFINFYLAPSALAASITQAIETDMWGGNSLNAGKKIMVEYTDPNPFKEFHIGHLMSNAIGESISRFLQFSGAEVKRANYQGDVGPHVAKAIWAMKKGQVKNLGMYVEAMGAFYTEGTKQYEENLDARKEIDEINQKVYDKSDPEINYLYDIGRSASLSHFDDIYEKLGTEFDFSFFESETASKGIEIVKAHPEVFMQSDGAIVYKGEQDGLHTRVFITSKGLPTYEAKDLGLAELKTETWPFDQSITITAQEQADYFAVVLAAMKKVLPQIAPKIRHISHGMMRFAQGKMSSRTGNVITGASLLNDLTEQAKLRASESRADDKAKLAQQVAVAAIKYQILKQASGKNIVFDKEKSLSLEGDSGPYLQYAHARACAIIEKAKAQKVVAKVGQTLESDEITRLLSRFPEIVERAAAQYEPHIVTTYLIEIASSFNSWYAQEQILDGSDAAAHKVALTDAVRKTLKNGLWLLGIPSPEKM